MQEAGLRDGFDTSPLNPIAPVVWLLVLPIAAMEIVLSLAGAGLAGGAGGIGWRSDAIQRFALSPRMLDVMIETGRWEPDFLMRFLAYPVVHGSFMHALFATVFLLALGKMVSEVFSPLSVLAVFFVSGVIGAVVYSLVPGVEAALLGAYPPVYGLIGAFTFILWARLGAVQAHRYRAFTLIGFLLGVQLVFGLIFGGGPEWIADVTSFAVGFGLSFLVGPGGPARMLRAIRQR
jgi:membrane associated rhomboid family serine protease